MFIKKIMPYVVQGLIPLKPSNTSKLAKSNKLELEFS
jgi:hypothetical protein